MSASSILQDVEQLGATLRVRDGRVFASPAGRLPLDLRQRILEHKVEIVTALATAPPSQGVADRPADQDGLGKPPNASVYEMFKEARARLGSRDLEERSITRALRRLFPAVAALWPDASLDAAWLDWRLKLGAAHLPALDAAWQAIVRSQQPDGPLPALPAERARRRSRTSKRKQPNERKS